MRRIAVLLGLSTVASCLALVAAERDASACGGCFHPPAQTVSDITDERMLLAVSTQQTTLYDQIEYSGTPTSFAWVLPIHGTVTVGLSADVMFDSIDTLTTTTINQPPPNCPGPPSYCGGGGGFGPSAPSGGAGLSASADAGTEPIVTVTQQEQVGPYETVQLHSTDPNALNTWLTQNGYNIPSDVAPVVAAYVTEGFDFLAMKLVPGEGVQAMRPVRVTMPGASLSLPLRMAAVGTGATTGITIWVIADGRYEPQNFPFFHIDDSQLVWDFSTSSSNYTTLRTQDEASYGGKGWEIESSIDLNEQLITGVIESGGVFFGGGGFSAPQPADGDYLPIGSDDGGEEAGNEDGGEEGGAYESADQVRAADIAALFAGMAGPSVRLTRIRSDIAHSAMTTDFVVQASADQSELSNVRTVTQSVNLTCPIYDNCNIVGTGTLQQAQSAASANSIAAGTPGGAGGVGGGCVTSSRPNGSSSIGFGALAGIFALVGARVARGRGRKR